MSFARQKVLKALQAKGCRFLREGGRHTILEAAGGSRVEVPRHRDIRRGTARNIARQAGIDWQDFEQAIS
jgi:predicted RNA binding protein YcfA (HicA-like mRNA interferase family)